MFTSLKEAEGRLQELHGRLADPRVHADARSFRELGREHHHLEALVGVWRELERARSDLEEARRIVQTGEDPELVELAQAEIVTTQERLDSLQTKLQGLLIPPDPDDGRNTIVEIRAGTGGEEAALFAADLFRMYHRYAERRGWRLEVMSTSQAEAGGFKEIIFLLSGGEVFGRMRWESGVHRVQRVPRTEAQGRIHTSAASVVVLPEAEEVEVALEPDDLRVDVFRSSGPGGQSVNTTDSAVRVTHLPTGLVVSCQDEKSQHKNKAKALKILRSRLLERLRSEQAASEAAERRQMVAGGDRSAKIRTYNFPQNRVTDHRVKLTLYDLDGVMDGELDGLIDRLRLELGAGAGALARLEVTG
jgi:peptide chain release factor 1